MPLSDRHPLILTRASRAPRWLDKWSNPWYWQIYPQKTGRFNAVLLEKSHSWILQPPPQIRHGRPLKKLLHHQSNLLRMHVTADRITGHLQNAYPSIVATVSFPEPPFTLFIKSMPHSICPTTPLIRYYSTNNAALYPRTRPKNVRAYRKA